MSTIQIAILSPDPSTDRGGVERFCHELSAALNAAVPEWHASVLGVEDFKRCRTAWSLVVTNGTGRVHTSSRRVHVYHGCWWSHTRVDQPDASALWRAKWVGAGIASEVRAGLGAYRVAVSRSTAREVRRSYKLRVDSVVPNGVDTTVFRSLDRVEARRKLGLAPNGKYLLFVGRDEYRKRPDLARAAGRAANFTIINAGPSAIEGMQYLGSLGPPELAVALSASDALIAPSGYEACSLAILESLSCGRGVIATRTGWIPDLLRMVPAYAALTAPVGDLEGLVSATSALHRQGETVRAAASIVRRDLSEHAFRERWANIVASVLRLRK